MKNTARVFMTTLMVAGLGIASAATSADSSGSIHSRGTIDALPSSGSKYISISDSNFLIAPGIRVHTPTQDHALFSALKVGQKVEFSVIGGLPGVKDSVSEIWILPSK